MENIHGGHRDRMRSRYLQEGPDGFADHELLEMLLYGCIPRGDTNPVAHLLLKEFGSLSNLLESDAHEIAKTEGVGLKSAIFLTQLHEVIRRYEREKLGSKPELTSITRCVEYCRQLLSHYSTERFYIICTDSRRRVIHVAKLAEGTVGSVFVSNRQAVEVALRYKSAGVIFCHNRKDIIFVDIITAYSFRPMPAYINSDFLADDNCILADSVTVAKAHSST